MNREDRSRWPVDASADANIAPYGGSMYFFSKISAQLSPPEGLANMANKSLKNNSEIRTNRRLRKVPAVPAKPQIKESLATRSKKRAKRPIRVVHRTPNYKPLSIAANDFIDKSEGILQIFKEKNLDKYTSVKTNPYKRPLSIFKRESYDLLKQTIYTPGGHKIVKSIHSNLQIYHRGPPYHVNPFYWGILAMDHERDAPVLTPQEVGLLARQMYYADRHGVPPCLFVGFLYQAGITAEISQEKSQNGTESWGKSEMVRTYEPVE